tara:strand:+ start:650 stop:883 length:234 start_codon:yes stop_codon:yes gene_type:complete
MTKKRYFHEVVEEEQKMLDIGLKQSRQHKKDRTVKEKSLHEVLMEGFREEQEQRRLEEEDEKTPSELLQDELEPIDD